jgi:hypothetical protein
VGLRWILAAAFAAALAPTYGASASQTTPDGALGELRSRIDEAQVSSAAARVAPDGDRLRARALARLSQAGRARVRFRPTAGTTQPLEAGFSGARCRGGAPSALSGFMLVRADTTGQMHLSDFFPSLNPAGTRARRWLVGVRNVTFEPQDWLGGAVCSQTRVRYQVFDSAVGPFESHAGLISCPRRTPNAVSGFFLVGSETTGQLQLGDFFPELRGRPGEARARGWVVGVKNLTDRRQEWLGGVVCTRATVRFSTGSGQVAPLGTLVGRARCPRAAPNAVSGFSLVVTENSGDTFETGHLQLSDFFPILSGPRSVAREWAVGVRNLTDQPREWIWGAMCLGGERGSGGPATASAAQQPLRPRGIRRQGRAGRRARLEELCKKPLWRRLHPRQCRRF